MSQIYCVGVQSSVVELLRRELPEHDFVAVEPELKKGDIGHVESVVVIRSAPLITPPEMFPRSERRVAEYQAPGRARHKKGKR